MVETQEEQGKTDRPTENSQLLVFNLWKHMKVEIRINSITSQKTVPATWSFKDNTKSRHAKDETAKFTGRIMLWSPASSKFHNQPSFLIFGFEFWGSNPSVRSLQKSAAFWNGSYTHTLRVTLMLCATERQIL